MNITIIATGKCKNKHINAQVEEFIKRLKPYFKTKLIEVPQVKASSVEAIKKGEAQKQLSKIPSNSAVFALDEKGETPNTQQFSQYLSHLRDNGTKNLTFIIGGAEGLGKSISDKSNKIISLSKLTFPHMMVRPILLEQIYRAGTLLANHPYHREG